MLLNLLNKCACIINLIDINILFLIYSFLRTGYYLSACKKRRGIICPHVQIYGVLFVRLCKSTGYCLSACANRRGTMCPHVQKWRGTICPGYYLSVTLWPQVQKWRGTICPGYYLSVTHLELELTGVVDLLEGGDHWKHLQLK